MDTNWHGITIYLIQAAEAVMLAAIVVEVTWRTLAITVVELRKSWRIFKGDRE
jgi:hypothetical protein